MFVFSCFLKTLEETEKGELHSILHIQPYLQIYIYFGLAVIYNFKNFSLPYPCSSFHSPYHTHMHTHICMHTHTLNHFSAAATAKSLQSCPILCDPMDGSPPGSPVPGILQCSCLENPRDGGAWWAAVYGVAQNWTRLKWLSSSRSRHGNNGSVYQQINR